MKIELSRALLKIGFSDACFASGYCMLAAGLFSYDWKMALVIMGVLTMTVGVLPDVIRFWYGVKNGPVK